MKEKRAKHVMPHKTGRKGYHGKQKDWQEEDEKLAAEGKDNPWQVFPGRSRPFLRARSDKTTSASGEITFSDPKVAEVADKVKRKASDGSFSGVRENDVLTAALENPEHRGRVRGVSSSIGWGEGFGEEFQECTGRRRRRGLMRIGKR